MALIGLPDELLELIVLHTLPEGFESLTLTCKKIHAICTPFLGRHNTLRSHFHRFSYKLGDSKTLDPGLITCAWDLIAHIAVEPIVARYIRYADFGRDSCLNLREHWRFESEYDILAEVSALFAGSTHLREAKLDPHEYHTTIVNDLEGHRYSQLAAAFLLTLLPSVKVLRLPLKWMPHSASNKVLDGIVNQTNCSHNLLWNTPSLYQTTTFNTYQLIEASSSFDLAHACPFLALPRVRTFRGCNCVATRVRGSYSSLDPSKSLYPSSFGANLVTIHLLNSCLDEVDIASLLRYTTHLRTLVYTHSTKAHCDALTKRADWSLCDFVTAIEHAVAGHLEELGISIRTLEGSILPGTASLRNFQRLRKLELPVELFSSNIAAFSTPYVANRSSALSNIASDNRQKDEGLARIGDLLPASVSELSLKSDGRLDHATALKVMFQNFALRKEVVLPNLKEMKLSCIDNADRAYKKECEKLKSKLQKAKVHLDLVPYLALPTLAWNIKD